MIPGSRAFERAWYGGARWPLLLWPLEWLYRAGVFLRRAAYRHGLARTYRAAVPVVVVGNLTLGGTGKTPAVVALVEALAGRGLRAGVVSRGYGARGAAFPHRVGDASRVGECGDEPLLIYRRTGCPVVVDPDRAAAARALLDQAPVDLIVSDDGLQHYALGRQLEIVLFDARDAFGNGHCLPCGPLREPLSRLGEADFVLGRGAGGESGLDYRPRALVNIQSGERRAFTPDSLGGDVDAVAGLGRPALFLAMLEGAGFRPRPRLFPDHHDYAAADFATLSERPVIMTEKDALKCRGLAGADAWYLEIDARLPEAVVDAAIDLASGRSRPDTATGNTACHSR